MWTEDILATVTPKGRKTGMRRRSLSFKWVISKLCSTQCPSEELIQMLSHEPPWESLTQELGQVSGLGVHPRHHLETHAASLLPFPVSCVYTVMHGSLWSIDHI